MCIQETYKMNDTPAQLTTGGRFLVEPVGCENVLTRECFSEEHREIEGMVRDFASERVYPLRDEIEKFDKDLCVKLLREMAELGLLGIDIPEAYGGLELDKVTSAIVVESLARGYSASFTVIFSVQTGIGSLPIVWFGTPEQKEKYLPRLVSAEWISAYSLTEASSGSDALAAKTRADLSEDGKSYILNGEKMFTTNGGWADVYTIFAQVDGRHFSAFIVERDSAGLEVGPEEKKMGVKGSSTTPITLTDVRVPAENLLYEIGKGATIAFNALNLGRFKLAAADLGGSKTVLEEAVKYARDRRQFGQAIAAFDVIKGKIADMTVRIYTADSMIYRTIGLIQEATDRLDKDDPLYYIHMGEATEEYAIEASMAKVYGSETLGMVTDHGIQILGGYGFIEEFPMARPYRDTRIDRIWEGSNEINRQIITGYMIKKALLEELPIRTAIRDIDAFLESDVEQAFSGAQANEECAIETGKRLALHVFHAALNEFGQDLRHEQQLTEILADMFTYLYVADSTLSRVQCLQGDAPVDKMAATIARIHSAEVSIRLLNLALTGLHAIFHGKLPPDTADHLRRFQRRMLPETDIIQLKRALADYVYSRNGYPF
ncbi:MAG: acyl-CoA dehydrogenase family protein [gamma proteobacterium endosymbiont of Lamellibrachia anaximandri]|nr:acyl-CoA dehydrogenase family protein [gamma proteobacterium endosymbiont of Lamellibrachia anaximandri]